MEDRIVDLNLLSADKLEEAIEGGQIKAGQLGIVWGITADKALRLREIDRRYAEPNVRNYGPVVIITQPSQPLPAEDKVIEGEARHLPPDESYGLRR